MAKLPSGRFVIVDTSDPYVRGALVNSMRFRDELTDGVYPQGTIIQHVISGSLFKVEITAQAVTFNELNTIQQDRAERYRAHHWPNPSQRPRPRLRKR